MLKVLSNILCDLDPKVKVIGQKAGICDGVPSTFALVNFFFWKKNTILCILKDISPSKCIKLYIFFLPENMKKILGITSKFS